MGSGFLFGQFGGIGGGGGQFGGAPELLTVEPDERLELLLTLKVLRVLLVGVGIFWMGVIGTVKLPELLVMFVLLLLLSRVLLDTSRFGFTVAPKELLALSISAF